MILLSYFNSSIKGTEILGSILSDKRLNIDISQVMRKFYAAANAIFSHCKYASEFAKLLFTGVIYPTNANV